MQVLCVPIGPCMNFGTNTSKAESIRKRFREWIRARSLQELPHSMLETTLLQGGCYIGRRFSLLGFSLLWLIDEQQIKLFGPDGSLIESENLRDFCKSKDATPTEDSLQ